MNAKNWTFQLLLVVILNSNYLSNVFEKTIFKLNKCYKYCRYPVENDYKKYSSRNVQFLVFIFLCSCFKKSLLIILLIIVYFSTGLYLGI